jgi:bifunctional N-acetylglucosamine-1-phosphate-uridyltransferase/glucosamine-1-phosphate-acetyltransferase GlmU-like protein
MYKEGTNVNTYTADNVIHSVVVINKNSATTLLPANNNRVAYFIYSTESKIAYIREQKTLSNNDKHGHIVSSGFPLIKSDILIYKGEVSAISENTNNYDLYVTEITRE